MDEEFKNEGSYDIRVAGFGHNILIMPGVTMRIPKCLHGDVVRQGGVPINPDAIKLEADRPEEEAHKKADVGLRNKTIKQVIRTMVAENDSSEWGANGKPKVGPVSDRLGHKVTAAEIADAWESIRPETV